KRHVKVGNPHESKEAEQGPAPVAVNQPIVRDPEKQACQPVAKAVFASKQVEEFALNQVRGLFTATDAEFTRFAENLLMRNGPADAGDGNRDQQQLNDFKSQFPERGHYLTEAQIHCRVASGRAKFW